MRSTFPQPIVILGTRTLAEEVADLASEMQDFKVEAFVENMKCEPTQRKIGGLPVIWIKDLADLVDTHLAICALATTHRDLFVSQVAKIGMRFATLVHPSALVSSSISVGEGTIISRGANIGSRCQIGKHVWIGRGVLIGHHTRIGDFVTVQMGANVAGACEIDAATYIGTGASIIDHLKIGARCVIGAGAVVIEDLPSRVLAVGVPARIIREGIDGK